HTGVAAVAIVMPLSFANRTAAATVVAIDLLIAAYPVNVYAPRTLFDPPPLAGAVRDLVGPMRFYGGPAPATIRAPTNDVFWLARRRIEALSGYTATMFGIATIFHTDYDALAPEAIGRLGERMHGMPPDRGSQL